MRRGTQFGLFSCLVLWTLSAWAQAPEIFDNGVVNSAGNISSALLDPSASPTHVIARGALLTVRGAYFGDRLQDIVMQISTPSGQAPLTVESLHSTPLQSTLTARVPRDAPLGRASLLMSVHGLKAFPYAVSVVASAFGIYSMNGKGWGPGRIQQVSPSGKTLNNVSNSAAFAQTLMLSGTGLGDAKNPVVSVGGKTAKVISASASALQDEIEFEVPPDAPEGCFVPVQVRNAGSLPSNTVTVSIHKGGGACQVPAYFPFAQWTNAAAGLVMVGRTAQRLHGAQPVLDEAVARFVKLPELGAMHSYFLLPPPGTCTTEIEPWNGQTPPDLFGALLASHFGAKGLHAGAELAIDDGKTLRKIPAFGGIAGLYDRQISDWAGRPDQLLRLLNPAALRITGKGGAEIGPFKTELPGVRPFEMVGSLGPVRRGEPLHLEWTGMDDAHVAIVAANFTDFATEAQGTAYCLAPRGASSFTIPAAALAYFPPQRKGASITLRVIAWPVAPVFFQARGLDHGFAVSAFAQSNMDAGQ